MSKLATFGMGCFWCYQPIFKALDGVISVEVGYSGGDESSANYEQVGSGKTNHAEAIQITFDPEIISFSTLLDVFWHMHNPTTLNRQGNDSGPQYRSVIFYHSIDQKNEALNSLKQTQNSNVWEDSIVTEITEFDAFYKAESYHQDFYEKNPNYGYCSVVINPKVSKFREKYDSLLKKSTENE